MKNGSVVDIIVQLFEGPVEKVKNEFDVKAVPLGQDNVSIRVQEEVENNGIGNVLDESPSKYGTVKFPRFIRFSK